LILFSNDIIYSLVHTGTYGIIIIIIIMETLFQEVMSISHEGLK